ncbi:MAG TPA: hypothetical protein VN901_27705 [Candidatus Acidoferrales bacterium]|nr:hypothetical protein [Candidatus Acidoferrales bacterium]
MPQDWNYGTDRTGDATIVTRYVVEGFERLWLVKKSTPLGVKNSPTMKSSGLSVGIGPGSRILYRVIPPVVGLEGL